MAIVVVLPAVLPLLTVSAFLMVTRPRVPRTADRPPIRTESREDPERAAVADLLAGHITKSAYQSAMIRMADQESRLRGGGGSE